MREKKRSDKSKERHKAVLLEYLSNPDNKPVNRKGMSIDVLGFADGTVLYQVFSPEEIRDIEQEALELRRKCYATKLAKVDDGLLERAMTGDPAAAKLAFQRYEQWSEKQKQEITFDGPMLQQIFAIFPPEIATKIKLALIAKHKELAKPKELA